MARTWLTLPGFVPLWPVGCVAVGLALAGCSTAAPTARAVGATPLGPLYNVPPYLLRPDGMLINGLPPSDPNDQS